MSEPFEDVVTTVEELRTLYRQPSSGALRKQISAIDANCASFVEHSPFVLVGTSAPDGSCDVSPRGGPAGFVRVLDSHRLAIPDLAGNNRLDSLTNLVANPRIALLFLVPGLDETLRVNGRGWVVRDPAVLDACEVEGKRPRVVVGVEVTEAYIHCAKAFRRAAVWQPDGWPDRSDMPTIACMLKDHLGDESLTESGISAAMEQGYEKTMWEIGADVRP